MNNSSKKDNKHIFLIGPPNSGKTTLFNWLTGFKHRVVNYPGSTVLLSTGKLLEKYNLPVQITDTPGVYSLFPQSQDEQATVNSLFENKNISTLIVVLDASKLEIQLPLLFQLKEAGFPFLVALTMWDLLPKNTIDPTLLEKSLDVPVIPIKGIIGDGVRDLTESLKSFIEKKIKSVQKPKQWSQKRFTEISDQSKHIVKDSSLTKNKDILQKKENIFYSNKFDKIFLHPKKGLFLFACIMFGFFYSIFWFSAPFMDAIDETFSFLVNQTNGILSSYPYLANFISYGLLSSFGVVLVFVPQIFILFLGLSFLEDTGYLARAVALTDGPLSKIGLSGRSFVPFLSGYACAIPAILAARRLDSTREKFMTFFAIPFMSCSARLPVYAILLGFLFYGQAVWKPSLALSLIYLASFLLGITAVSIMNLVLKKENKGVFLLDLPIYRRPVLKKVLKNAGKQTQHYIVKAGPAIFTVALAIWVLSHFPLQPELNPTERIQQSYAGQIGQMIEPLFGAMGLDWRVGVALIVAFAAREVFVSALILLFSITESAQEIPSLLATMKNASHSDGSLIFTTASVTALVVFFMFSLQCLSTTAVIYKESGSLKLALTQLLVLNVLAYILAVLVYQSLTFIL